jgi:hypothetical protein
MRARYYAPELGRFQSEDSARDGLNWFSYCISDPVNNVDESGKRPLNWSETLSFDLAAVSTLNALLFAISACFLLKIGEVAIAALALAISIFSFMIALNGGLQSLPNALGDKGGAYASALGVGTGFTVFGGLMAGLKGLMDVLKGIMRIEDALGVAAQAMVKAAVAYACMLFAAVKMCDAPYFSGTN